LTYTRYARLASTIFLPTTSFLKTAVKISSFRRPQDKVKQKTTSMCIQFHNAIHKNSLAARSAKKTHLYIYMICSIMLNYFCNNSFIMVITLFNGNFATFAIYHCIFFSRFCIFAISQLSRFRNFRVAL